MGSPTSIPTLIPTTISPTTWAPTNGPEPIEVFGLKTSSDFWSGANETINVRLFWGQYSYECPLIAAAANTWYLCDTSNVTTLKCDADNSTTSRFAMLIENDTPDQLKIDEIYIQNITNYYYGVNAFCLNSNIWMLGEIQRVQIVPLLMIQRNMMQFAL